MIIFLILMASFSTEAWALPASTRHCMVSSSKVLMPELFKSGLGRMSVVGILLWHATKTWIIAGFFEITPSFHMCWQLAKNLVPTGLTWPTHTYRITPNFHMARTGQRKNNSVVCEIHENRSSKQLEPLGLENAPNARGVAAFCH